jgi:FPC/CPF motif-containing protein YcgG
MDTLANGMIDEFLNYIGSKDFPCIAAKAALAENQILTFVADHLACPHDDKEILNFLQGFVDGYREAKKMYHTAAVIFKAPVTVSEEIFDELLWQRLQCISDLDATSSRWDERVSRDPASPDFSYSIHGEALYVVGMHANSSRLSRQFNYPTFVFNPHSQFERLRASHKYIPMRDAVRKRDIKLDGSINPMLADFGESSEAYQYSGRQYEKSWQCPFFANHERTKHHSTS